MRILTLLGILVAVFALSRRAAAEEFTRRSYTLPDGSFEITGEPARPKVLGINMSRNQVAEPVYLAPHFYWGVSERITIGITHEQGLCMTGENKGCRRRPYDDVGFAMLVGVAEGPGGELDFHLGAPISSFDPFTLGAKFGVLGRINAGSFAFVFDPFLYVGITPRDGAGPFAPPGFPGPGGNREILVIPVWFYFQVSRAAAPFVGTGVAGPLDNFGDNFQVPVEFGIVFEVANDVDLGVVFRFHNLLGNEASADFRELGMLARFRF